MVPLGIIRTFSSFSCKKEIFAFWFNGSFFIIIINYSTIQQLFLGARYKMSGSDSRKRKYDSDEYKHLNNEPKKTKTNKESLWEKILFIFFLYFNLDFIAPYVKRFNEKFKAKVDSNDVLNQVQTAGFEARFNDLLNSLLNLLCAFDSAKVFYGLIKVANSSIDLFVETKQNGHKGLHKAVPLNQGQTELRKEKEYLVGFLKQLCDDEKLLVNPLVERLVNESMLSELRKKNNFDAFANFFVEMSSEILNLETSPNRILEAMVKGLKDPNEKKHLLVTRDNAKHLLKSKLKEIHEHLDQQHIVENIMDILQNQMLLKHIIYSCLDLFIENLLAKGKSKDEDQLRKLLRLLEGEGKRPLKDLTFKFLKLDCHWLKAVAIGLAKPWIADQIVKEFQGASAKLKKFGSMEELLLDGVEQWITWIN